MYRGNTVALILPAKNEALALPCVLKSVPPEIDRVLVVDNGSTDETSKTAADLGAQVIEEPRTGYGMACLAGMVSLDKNPPDIVAFADADGSDDLSRIIDLLKPLASGHADFVLERRMAEKPEDLSYQQRFGNWLSTCLVRLIWGYRYRDLGPMRAIKWRALQNLRMKDRNYGWTVEMQIRALKKGIRVMEIPVPYRGRIAGVSKVSRNLKGSVRAGIKILWVIGSEALTGPNTIRRKIKV